MNKIFLIRQVICYAYRRLAGERSVNMDIVDKQKYIFFSIHLLSNRLKVIGDHVLGDGSTIRQWLLTATISQFGENPPVLGEVAEMMGTSHQNVKQLALKLKQKGLLTIYKDEHDLRVTRLILTEKSLSFLEKRQCEVIGFLKEIFKDLSKEEIHSLEESLNKLHEGVLIKKSQFSKIKNSKNKKYLY
jgi:DNA-binding MarR family transcriptional regulator